MKTASQIVHGLCGSPRYDDCQDHDPARCWVCAGVTSRSMPQPKWNGSSFTGQNRVRCPDSAWVCEACVFVASRIAPVPGRPAKPGKKFGGNFRNYSHLYDSAWQSGEFGDDGSVSRGYINASKGEKPAIRAFLAMRKAGDWFAAIADSGQKHTLPWAPLNPPSVAGTVLFDETLVRVPTDQRLVDEVTELLTAGVTKDEIQRGDYTPRAWTLAPDMVRSFESRHSGERHSSWFGLAVWLAQRDEERVAVRLDAEKAAKKTKAAKPRKGKRDAKRAAKRGTTDQDGGGAAGPASRLSADTASKHTQELGSAPKPDASSGANLRKPRGVGNQDPARPTDPGAQQLGFTGFD